MANDLTEIEIAIFYGATVSWIHVWVHTFSLHDMVQHFDHVFHHLTSATIKEHVPPTAQHGGKRQRGLMEATVINFFIKWSRTHSAIIFRKTPSKIERSEFGNLGFWNQLQWLEVSRLFLVFSVLIHIASTLESNIACKFLTLISIVFTNGQFSGNTLEIQGSSPQFQKYREVSMVSGSGRFILQGAMLYLRLFLLTHQSVAQWWSAMSLFAILNY